MTDSANGFANERGDTPCYSSVWAERKARESAVQRPYDDIK